jgi:effector-binding domain-containing protein
MADVAAHFQTVMPEVGMAFAQNNVPMTGDPVGLYYTWDMEKQTSDMAIGIPTTEEATIDGLTAITLTGSPALQIDYVGDYEGTIVAHEAIEAYLNANNLTAKLPAIERYLAKPGPENLPDNPEKWVTQVVYLLEK